MFSLQPKVDALVDRLHARSDAQEKDTTSFFAALAAEGKLDRRELGPRVEQFMSDKLVALERDKAQFCYYQCRALRAHRVVEIGTSWGVSTLYLAAAIRDDAERSEPGIVVATEYEPEKIKAARAHFEEAGLSKFIDLREGDLRQTLRDLEGPIDFVLMDIWTPMARPAIELLSPHLRPGAVIITDNTIDAAEGYRDYFEFLNDPANRLRTMTLPFKGGLEFTVRV